MHIIATHCKYLEMQTKILKKIFYSNENVMIMTSHLRKKGGGVCYLHLLEKMGNGISKVGVGG